MKHFTNFSDIKEKIPNAIITLGAFDGIHLGHKKIITRCVNIARSISGTSVVFTFSNHPLSLVDNKRMPLMITSNKDKEELVSDLGVDVLCNAPFTAEVLSTSADGFVNFLRKLFDVKTIIVGANYTYGHKGAGTAYTLREAGKRHGFHVDIIDIVSVKDRESNQEVLVSSSNIRDYIKAGQVEKAEILLGRPFNVTNKVVRGEERGRILGFPTANIDVQTNMLFPKDGVYIIQTALSDGSIYKGVANVGDNPTFFGEERRIEAHIFDFTGNLYGQSIKVEFLGRLRDEMKFNNVQELIEQIRKDVEQTKDFFLKK